MHELPPPTEGDEIALVNTAMTAEGAISFGDDFLLAIHWMPGETSEPDLDRLLGNGQLALHGRFLLSGEDVSLVIWRTGIQSWTDGELAYDNHPLRIFVDEWRDVLLDFHEAVTRDVDDTLVMVGRWVDFFGDAPGALVIYLCRIVGKQGIWTAPFISGLAACDLTLGGSGFDLVLAGQDAKQDQATLRRQTRRRVLAENRRLGYAYEQAVEGMVWWSKDLSRAEAHSITIIVPEESVLCEVS